MDGTPLVDELNGTVVSLDPGEHKFVFEFKGLAPVEKLLLIRESEKAIHQLITFGAPADGGQSTETAMGPQPVIAWP